MACLSSRYRAADLEAHDTVLWILVGWRSWPRYDLHAQSNSLRTMLSEVDCLRRTVLSPPWRPDIPRLLPIWLESPACIITRTLSLYLSGSSPEIIRNCCCPSTALATFFSLEPSESVTGNLLRSIALSGSSRACPDESNAVQSRRIGQLTLKISHAGLNFIYFIRRKMPEMLRSALSGSKTNRRITGGQDRWFRGRGFHVAMDWKVL